MNNTEKKIDALIDSDGWGCIVKYIMGHHNDIENNIGDYGTLQPLLDFMKYNNERFK